MRTINEILQDLKPRRRALVLGSVFVDFLINTPQLPVSGSDITAAGGGAVVGGCAFNAADVLLKLNLPFDSLLPVGEGLAAAIIKEELKRRRFACPQYRGCGDNGICVTLVESSGERSFITLEGLDSHFEPAWLQSAPIEEADFIYLSGYQAEGPGAEVFLQALGRMKEGACLLFDPGPRVPFIKPEVLTSLERHRVLYNLNAAEAMALSGCHSVEEAARALHRRSGQAVVVTCGAQGALLCENGSVTHVPAFAVEMGDSVGSGDAHSGGLLAGLICGLPLSECVKLANACAAAVTAQQGPACALPRDALAGRFGDL